MRGRVSGRINCPLARGDAALPPTIPLPLAGDLPRQPDIIDRPKDFGNVIGNVVKEIGFDQHPATAFEDVDILVSDCLRRDPHPTHANLALAMELAERCGAKRLVLSHLDKSMDYAAVSGETPDHVLVGYDGMVVEA